MHHCTPAPDPALHELLDFESAIPFVFDGRTHGTPENRVALCDFSSYLLQTVWPGAGLAEPVSYAPPILLHDDEFTVRLRSNLAYYNLARGTSLTVSVGDRSIQSDVWGNRRHTSRSQLHSSGTFLLSLFWQIQIVLSLSNYGTHHSRRKKIPLQVGLTPARPNDPCELTRGKPPG